MTSRKLNTYVGLSILIFAALLCVSCRRQTVAAPPPPPPVPAPPPAPEPVITLTAQPSTIDRGQATTLTWETRNAGNVSIEPGIGTVATAGTRGVNPASSVTYQATATGPGGTATAVARITVNAPPPPPAAARPAPPAAPSLTVDQLFTQNVQDILFDYDQSEVRSDQIARLQSNATWLKTNPNVRFTVQGHADERGSQEYNLALGDRRANAVKQYLVSQGVSESRIEVVSYGEERPVCSEQTEDCFQRNRRAAFVMTR